MVRVSKGGSGPDLSGPLRGPEYQYSVQEAETLKSFVCLLFEGWILWSIAYGII
jgi:hypothetical protein